MLNAAAPGEGMLPPAWAVLADLIHDVIIEQVANLLGVDPEDLD